MTANRAARLSTFMRRAKPRSRRVRLARFYNLDKSVFRTERVKGLVAGALMIGATRLFDATALGQTLPPSSPSSFDMSVGTQIASDYIFRGYSLTNHLPSVSGYFEGTYGWIFAGLEADSVQLPGLPTVQLTASAGIRPKFGPASIDIGVSYYSYPGSGGVSDYPEYFIRPSLALSPALTVGANFTFAPDYSRTGAHETYISATGKYLLSSTLSLSGEIGFLTFTSPTSASWGASNTGLPSYAYGTFGLSYVYKIATFDLRFHATSLSRQDCFLITGAGDTISGSDGCGPGIFFTVSLDSTLSAIRKAISAR